MKDNKINEQYFQEPPVEYRPAPFWGLTKTLKEEDLLSQIEEMKDKGWGGFFMHARYPLVTPYLSKEYMDLMTKCVHKAKELGLKAWIYDEYPWCSGSAGGLTAARKKEYRSKAMVLNVHHRLTPIDPEESYGYYALKLNENGIPKEAKRIEDPERYEGEEHYYLHFYLFQEPLSAHYEPGFFDDCVIHGFAAADNLNPEAVKKYIEITYGSFYKAVGKEFGETLMGGFSDMPTYNWNYSTPHPSIPWTTGFEQYFQRMFGYDLIPHLPALFFDIGEDYEKIRCDYWKAASKLFVDTFTRQLYEWCEKHRAIYSGHYWGEETLHWQIPWCGDVMQHFKYQHYVGMDHSIKTIEDPLGVKQASTVAEQLGKPRMMAESYGLSGNGLSHEQRKWIADWEYALGANFLIPYIAQCSLKGRAKRDEPASIFVQQPYWPYEKTIYDYYGRLSYMLTRGKRSVNILLMQPLETARTLYTANKYVTHCYRPDEEAIFESANVSLYEYNQKWMELGDALLAMHRDFHIGNESLLEEYGDALEEGLRVGNYSYQVVIIPPSRSWSWNTIQLLNEFSKKGGKIIAVEPLPTEIGGEKKEEVLPPTIIKISNDRDSLKKALDEIIDRDVCMPDCGDILYQHRHSEEAEIWFFANTSLENRYINTKIGIRGKGQIQIWDALTGQRYQTLTMEQGGRTWIELDFYPVTSYLIVQKEEGQESLPMFPRLPEKFLAEKELKGTWEASTNDYNALVLDFCDLKIEREDWKEHLPMFKAQQRVSQAGIGSKYLRRSEFYVEQCPRDLFLCLEEPERLNISINGKMVSLTGNNWWVDPSFRVFNITEYVEKGRNVIQAEGVVGIDTELENFVLLGKMSVETQDGFRLKEVVSTVEGKDLTKEGYPFFTGSISMSQTVMISKMYKKTYLSFKNIKATLARVWINNKHIKDLSWKPYMVDISDYIQIGENEVRIELVTTRRNLFGPHHYKFKEQETFSVPARWVNEAYWMEEYYFSPLGIEGVKVCFCED